MTLKTFFPGLILSLALLIVSWQFCLPDTPSDQNDETLSRLKSDVGPKKIKTRTKLRILRYEDVDRQLADVHSWFSSNAPQYEFLLDNPDGPLQIRFSDIFLPQKENSYLPLTNNIIRQVPDSSLLGLEVFDKDGQVLGTYSNKYPFTRQGESSYTLFYFQYQLPDGRLRRSGTDLLLDRFLVRWDDVKDHPVFILQKTQ